MQTNFWTGTRVRLRAVSPQDAGTYFRWSADYDDESDRLCDVIHIPRNEEQMQQHVAQLAQRSPKKDEFNWIIEDVEGNAVGSIVTMKCNSRMGTFKYGISIVRSYWGQGYAKEAITIILRYYFQELRYQKVTVDVYSFNEGSQRLHEKLGFTLEGRLRRMIYTQGRYFDELCYGLTCEEFEQLDSSCPL